MQFSEGLLALVTPLFAEENRTYCLRDFQNYSGNRPYAPSKKHVKRGTSDVLFLTHAGSGDYFKDSPP